MHPLIAHLQALFAAVGARGHLANLTQVGAIRSHRCYPVSLGAYSLWSCCRPRALWPGSWTTRKLLGSSTDRSLASAAPPSPPPALGQQIGQALHVGDDDVRLVRGHAEGSRAAIDEGCIHAGGLRSDAIERMIR